MFAPIHIIYEISSKFPFSLYLSYAFSRPQTVAKTRRPRVQLSSDLEFNCPRVQFSLELVMWTHKIIRK